MTRPGGQQAGADRRHRRHQPHRRSGLVGAAPARRPAARGDPAGRRRRRSWREARRPPPTDAARAGRRAGGGSGTGRVRPLARRTPCLGAYRGCPPGRSRHPTRYHGAVGLAPPCARDDWVGLTADPLPLDDALRWAGLPSCGAAVLFTGNVRDFSPGRPGVHRLTYEAYEEEVEPRLAAIAADARVPLARRRPPGPAPPHRRAGRGGVVGGRGGVVARTATPPSRPPATASTP